MLLYSLSSAPPYAQTPEELQSPLESLYSPASLSPTPASDMWSLPACYFHNHTITRSPTTHMHHVRHKYRTVLL